MSVPNDDLAKVAPRIHVRKSSLSLAEFEYFVDHGLDRVLGDEGVHVLEVTSRPHEDSGHARAATDQ